MNFKALLQHELDKTTIDDNICHITFEPLDKDYIILDCKHTFNYEAIFKEVKQQKIVNRKEIQKIPKYCIKCPYCRFVQKGILPHRKPYETVHRVNTPKCHSFKMKKFQCNYIFASGKNKGNVCNKYSEIENCHQHHLILSRRKAKAVQKATQATQAPQAPQAPQATQAPQAPVNEIIQAPVNEIIQPVNEIIQPVNEIIQAPVNEIIQSCSHVFKRGKFKGTKCTKHIKNVYCNKHSKFKCNLENIT
jgi:hypothetical protein